MKPVLFFTFIVFILTASCKKIQQQDPVPMVEFTSFTIFDTTDILGNDLKGGRLKFYFEDGDGDLGLNAPNGEITDSTNLIFTLYRKTGGIMVSAPENDPLQPSSYRIPYMEREGINKMLKGTIAVTFLYLFYSDSDTIMYEFFIKDRATNESNIAQTNEIVLSKNGVY